ncbi:MAG: hypothetical protein JWO33_276 [Caulobacteraceae bacterium]|nr:hypothetical protein [Caulobacteraceae bacterium]
MQSPGETNHLVAAAVTNLEQRRDDSSSGPLVRDDAQRSIDVIQTFQRTVNALNFYGAQFLPAALPPSSMLIAGVEVSVAPDAVARIARAGEQRVGEVFIRCTIGTTGDAAENRRAEANGHLATIAHMHAVTHIAHLGAPYSPASMVIDVPRGVVVPGPANTTRRVRNIEDACRMIAAIWPTV